MLKEIIAYVYDNSSDVPYLRSLYVRNYLDDVAEDENGVKYVHFGRYGFTLIFGLPELKQKEKVYAN